MREWIARSVGQRNEGKREATVVSFVVTTNEYTRRTVICQSRLRCLIRKQVSPAIRSFHYGMKWAVRQVKHETRSRSKVSSECIQQWLPLLQQLQEKWRQSEAKERGEEWGEERSKQWKVKTWREPVSTFRSPPPPVRSPAVSLITVSPFFTFAPIHGAYSSPSTCTIASDRSTSVYIARIEKSSVNTLSSHHMETIDTVSARQVQVFTCSSDTFLCTVHENFLSTLR